MLLPPLPEAGPIAPWKEIVAERIREDRKPCHAALQAADIAWEQGHFDVPQLADYLSGLLRQQLSER